MRQKSLKTGSYLKQLIVGVKASSAGDSPFPGLLYYGDQGTNHNLPGNPAAPGIVNNTWIPAVLAQFGNECGSAKVEKFGTHVLTRKEVDKCVE